MYIETGWCSSTLGALKDPNPSSSLLSFSPCLRLGVSKFRNPAVTLLKRRTAPIQARGVMRGQAKLQHTQKMKQRPFKKNNTDLHGPDSAGNIEMTQPRDETAAGT